MKKIDKEMNKLLKRVKKAKEESKRKLPKFNKSKKHKWYVATVTGEYTKKPKQTYLRVCYADNKYYFVLCKDHIGTIRRDQVKILGESSYKFTGIFPGEKKNEKN